MTDLSAARRVTVAEGSIPEYQLLAAASGRCAAIARCSIVRESGKTVLCFDVSGLADLRAFLSRAMPRSVCASHLRALSAVRLIAESVAAASEYLIEPCYISLRAEDLFFFEGRAILLLTGEKREENVAERLARLCGEVGDELGPAALSAAREIRSAGELLAARSSESIRAIIRSISLREAELSL